MSCCPPTGRISTPHAKCVPSRWECPVGCRNKFGMTEKKNKRNKKLMTTQTIKSFRTFRAFKSRNYSLYFAGQSVSLIGTWMQKTAVSWVIYSLTHSTLMLGVTLFASLFPSFLFSLIGGV